MGMGWTAVVHTDDREAVLAVRSKAVVSAQEYVLQLRLQTRHQGISWVRLHSRPILSTDGRQIGRVGTIEDITEHKEAEERERRLHEQEARTRELRAAVHALERMAATLGHEMQNPLGAISNSAYFLCNRAGISDARALKHAVIIGREVQSARRVIDDILEFARTPQILLSPASLNVIADQALARSQIPREHPPETQTVAGPAAPCLRRGAPGARLPRRHRQRRPGNAPRRPALREDSVGRGRRHSGLLRYR